jgi:hypothetical protein
MSNLVTKYLELKSKHDSEFLFATGGNGNQEERKRKQNEYELPLLRKMTEEEFAEVVKNANGLGERMWLSIIKKEIFA